MSSWKMVKLGDVSVLKAGGTPSRSKKEYWDNGTIPWIKIKDFKGKYINKSEEKITETGLENSSTKILKKGTILYSIFASVGEVSILNIEATTNQAIVGIEVDENIIKTNFLFYFLISIKTRILSKSRGVAQNNVNLSILKEIEIPLLPMEIQEQIANTLDKVSEVIKLQKEKYKQLDNLIKSVFYEMFGDPVLNDKGWESRKLKDLTSKIGSGSTPRGGKEAYKTKGITLIRSMNIYDSKFIKEGLVFIDENQANKLKNVEIKKGDILFNITGASINRACMVPSFLLPARVNQHVSIIRPIKEINSIFLLNQLISLEYKKLLYNIATAGGATREAITKDNLENLNVLIPPLKLQEKFENIVKKIEKQKEIVEKTIENSENLFNSLMNGYFYNE